MRPSVPGPSRRRFSSKPALVLLVLLVAGAGTAAITLTYSNTSTVTTTVAPAPVQFAAGDDAGPSTLSTYVSAYSLSTNKTYMSATVKGVPESNLTVGSFFKLTNVDSVSRSATLSTPQVTNSYVGAYTLQIYDSSNALQGTMDLKAASPSVQVTIGAGATHYAKLTLTLASGAGADNVALTNAVTLSVA